MTLRVVCVGFAWLVAMSCSRNTELGSDLLQGNGGSSNAGNSGVDASAPTCKPTQCDKKTYACGDCADNDEDQLIDTLDPECTGPCDDTEESYGTGMSGQSDATCKLDCYFDGDNGAGNDDCHWSHSCDPLSLAPNYPPSGSTQCVYDPRASVPGTAATCTELETSQSAACLAACVPLTPVGCDCFGCCAFPLGSRNFVWLGSTLDGVSSCTALSLSDPTRCHPCTQVTACLK